ncbi:uncharacterized protein LOC110172719 [Boleophthalmus pectinirostris]|uniref:uncharacterized protein LOC110172719 n=1 Tax=Boleophthalmus pectinirostris TaxID=150288 RepID=UPI00242DFFED|nr:uncharacterized protein LOC110172719 [Boleophthalmus pectinirostris]
MPTLWWVFWRFCAVFCISASTTLCSKVEWRDPGVSITIKCEFKDEQEKAFLLNVKKGLNKNDDFYYRVQSETPRFAFPGRTQTDNEFPNTQIVLKNLTTNDTGVYWCLYETSVQKEIDGGSMLLVVRDPPHKDDKSTDSAHACNTDERHQILIVTSVVISSIVLLAVFIALLLLTIRKIKYSHGGNKSRPLPHNDVYEDMRGTIRR